MSAWDAVWARDSYSDPGLRLAKVRFKHRVFREMGVDFASFRSFLDVGCGAGWFSKHVAETYGARVLGVDSSEVGIEQAVRINSHALVQFQHGSVENVPGQFDALSLLGVLEHNHEAEQLLQSAVSRIKPGGLALLCWSNRLSIFALERQIREISGSWSYGYTRETTSRRLRDMSERSGLRTLSLETRPNEPMEGVLARLDGRSHQVASAFGRYLFYVGVLAE